MMIGASSTMKELDIALDALGARLTLYGRGRDYTAIVWGGNVLYGVGKGLTTYGAIDAAIQDLKGKMEKRA